MDTRCPRPARCGDVDAIRDLVRAAFQDYLPRLHGRRPAPLDADYAALVASGCVHVIVDATGVLAGVVVMRQEADHLLVETVAVHPARQGTGLGRCLLVFAEDVARRAALPELRLYTAEVMTENRALYRRCGWIETGRYEASTGVARVTLRKIVVRTPPLR